MNAAAMIRALLLAGLLMGPGAADQMGTCMPKPEACTREYQPVCGCDGKTYGNDCDRRSAGVAKQKDGAC